MLDTYDDSTWGTHKHPCTSISLGWDSGSRTVRALRESVYSNLMEQHVLVALILHDITKVFHNLHSHQCLLCIVMPCTYAFVLHPAQLLSKEYVHAHTLHSLNGVLYVVDPFIILSFSLFCVLSSTFEFGWNESCSHSFLYRCTLHPMLLAPSSLVRMAPLIQGTPPYITQETRKYPRRGKRTTPSAMARTK